MPCAHDLTPDRLDALKPRLQAWARELGFSGLGFAPVELGAAEQGLMDWLQAGCHGDMDYMARHGAVRARPTGLVPGTAAVISVRCDYLPATAATDLADARRAAVSRYALGRDYHKLLRQRLQRLAERLTTEIGEFGFRVFTDSAPVMEVALAARTSLGWRGKHTLLLSRTGSWFFLGEIYCSLPFAPDPPASAHCGTCQACLDVCPTQAIIAPYRLDARRCISYLTIEYLGAIPEDLRPLLGNRIYGCDDCQLVCPWNRYAQPSAEPDFQPRHGLNTASLVELFAWDEATFLRRMEGSAIRRIGHERWLRNIAVALGNALAVTPADDALRAALLTRRPHPSALVREHVEWALSRPAPSP
jgi:epoxyqueuosine reductase